MWGGKIPSGFDCSGFIYFVFNQAGMSGLYEITRDVSNPVVGDLVFFSDSIEAVISLETNLFIPNQAVEFQ